MHDLKYANQILEGLKKEAGKKRDVTMVVKVCLSPFSHVAPERLQETFGLLAKEEGFTNIKLSVKVSEFCVHCKCCGHIWRSSKPTFECPRCGRPDFDIKKYEEFRIDSIKIG
ncbi:MAG: hydrogenase maturation nickel metallochaperone HypA [Candidatus Omnitrophica bacterium]|nr:hydrogenase maturation nickel metallochaperone HypA [Candidatus Omnitrophota bacterium]